jgi:hypothetical protein
MFSPPSAMARFLSLTFAASQPETTPFNFSNSVVLSA